MAEKKISSTLKYWTNFHRFFIGRFEFFIDSTSIERIEIFIDVINLGRFELFIDSRSIERIEIFIDVINLGRFELFIDSRSIERIEIFIDSISIGRFKTFLASFVSIVSSAMVYNIDKNHSSFGYLAVLR